MVLPSALTQLSNPPTITSANKAVIEPVLEKVLNGVQSQRQTQLNATALRVQSQTVKTIIDVVVKEHIPINSEQHKTLSQQAFNPQLYGQKIPSADLLQLKQVLENKDLFLIKLLANDKAQWLISPEKLPVGKSLTLSVQSAHIWRTTVESSNKVISPTAKQLDTISQAIRESLPQAKGITSAIQSIQKISQQATSQGLALPRPLQQANTQLQQLVTSVDSFKQDKQLQTIIQQSGSVYESKLAVLTQLLQAANRPMGLTKKTLPSNGLDKIILSLLSAKNNGKPVNRSQQQDQTLTTARAKTAGNTTSNQNNNTSTVLIKDIKAQLIVLKNIADVFLNQTKSNAANVATKTNAGASAETGKPWEKNSANIVTPKLNHRQPDSANNAQTNAQKNVQPKLIQQIQQQAIAAIAKIQLQQSQSLLRANQHQQDGRLPSTQLQIEIPVQIEQNLHALHLKIEQDWIEKFKQGQDEDGKQEKVKRWQIDLNFELPKLGQFYARITHIQESTRVQFWADDEHTLAKAQEKLALLKSQLQSKGITVDDIRCEVGKPLTTKTKIDCALVDVCT